MEGAFLWVKSGMFKLIIIWTQETLIQMFVLFNEDVITSCF